MSLGFSFIPFCTRRGKEKQPSCGPTWKFLESVSKTKNNCKIKIAKTERKILRLRAAVDKQK